MQYKQKCFHPFQPNVKDSWWPVNLPLPELPPLENLIKHYEGTEICSVRVANTTYKSPITVILRNIWLLRLGGTVPTFVWHVKKKPEFPWHFPRTIFACPFFLSNHFFQKLRPSVCASIPKLHPVPRAKFPLIFWIFIGKHESVQHCIFNPAFSSIVLHDFVSWFQTLAALLERMGQVFWLNLKLPDGNADAM